MSQLELVKQEPGRSPVAAQAQAEAGAALRSAWAQWPRQAGAGQGVPRVYLLVAMVMPLRSLMRPIKAIFTAGVLNEASGVLSRLLNTWGTPNQDQAQSTCTRNVWHCIPVEERGRMACSYQIHKLHNSHDAS